jgi:hypothetical protein
MAMRRNVIRLGSVVGLLLGCILVISAPASAAPAIPGIPDCKDAPAAQLPGYGLPGFLDGKPDPLPVQGDPFAKNPTTSVYEQYGYAGLTWHTYDLGCGGDLRDVNASTDTMIGNATLAFATWGVAATNGLHNKIAHPSDYMAPLDDVVTAVSTRLKDAIWNPWGGAALLGVVVLLLWYSSAGRLSSVTKAAAWAVLVLAVMSGVAQYPARVSAFFDETVTGSIGQVNAATAGLSSVPATSDPARAQGGLLVDRLLYDSWLRGEFGSPESPAAKRWGPSLFKASAYTWAEAEQAQEPGKAKQLADDKANAWKSIAADIQYKDPNAYLALQGKAGARAGVGVMTVFGVAFTSIFRIVADLFMFAGLVMLRFLVMFFPAVAVLGVMAPMSAIVHRVANMAGAAVVNVIAFAAGAAVHTTVVSALLSRAQIGGMNLLVLILCLVSTLVAFVLLFPLLSLTNIVGMSAAGRGVHALRRTGRLVGRYAMTKKAVENGERDADLVGSSAGGEESGGEVDPASASAWGSSGYHRYRLINMPAESFGRPEPRQVPVMAGTAIGGGRVPVAALSAGSASRDGSSPDDEPGGGNGPLGRHRAIESGDLRRRTLGRSSTSNALTRDLVPIEGVVVEHPPSRMPEATVVHDSETIIASDGVGPRLFDPATKSSVRIDRNGNVIDEGRES